MSLHDWLPALPRFDRVERARVNEVSDDDPRGHERDIEEFPTQKGERRFSRMRLLSQIHNEVDGHNDRNERTDRTERRPDKVKGLQWAARAQERAVEDRRYDDALRAGRVVGQLMADLRGERE